MPNKVEKESLMPQAILIGKLVAKSTHTQAEEGGQIGRTAIERLIVVADKGFGNFFGGHLGLLDEEWVVVWLLVGLCVFSLCRDQP